MGEVVNLGLDIAKSVFQVHGVDAEAPLRIVGISTTRSSWLCAPSMSRRCEPAGR
jgi:hypothetical protein